MDCAKTKWFKRYGGMNIRLQWYFWGGIRILNLDDVVADRSQGFGAAWPSGAPAARHLTTVLVKTET